MPPRLHSPVVHAVLRAPASCSKIMVTIDIAQPIAPCVLCLTTTMGMKHQAKPAVFICLLSWKKKKNIPGAWNGVLHPVPSPFTHFRALTLVCLGNRSWCVVDVKPAFGHGSAHPHPSLSAVLCPADTLTRCRCAHSLMGVTDSL